MRLANGDYDDPLTCSYDSEKLITIGTGAMYDWTYGTAPWASYTDDITSVELPSRFTTIGDYAFYPRRSP